jgi:hypothetical protein
MLFCAFALSGQASAQMEDLGLFLYPKDGKRLDDASSSSFQIYRIPISFTLRSLEEHPWGLRLYIPLSLGTTRIDAVKDFDEFFEQISSVALVPGVEFLVPVGDRWVMKPFGEVGVGDDSASDSVHVLYSFGFRARGEYDPDPFHVMFGGAFRYRNNTVSEAVANWFSTIEVGADAQLPLGFSLGSKQARGGAYMVLRHFTDLDFELLENGPISVDWNYEAGLSFSTDPPLKLWIIKMPWIGIGYRWGDRITGFRLSFSFPF